MDLLPVSANESDAPSTLALLQQFRRCAHLQRHTSPHNGGTRILVKLLANGPVTQRALADLLERTPATLSQQLEPLEQRGLVGRAPLETDRRTMVVRLTEAGVAAAHEAQARPATLSQQLEPLEQRGLVGRAPLETDRRTMVVRLTEAGVAAAHEAQARRQQVADELFGRLDPQDRRDLLRILACLEDSWRSRATAADGGASR